MVKNGMPWGPRSRSSFSGGRENFFQQAGYALSLIPLVFAFARNPLVRRFGFRYLGQRMPRTPWGR